MVLTSKAPQLIPFSVCRPIQALAGVSVGLLHPSGNRLGGRLELTRQRLGRAFGSRQIDHRRRWAETVLHFAANARRSTTATPKDDFRGGRLGSYLMVRLCDISRVNSAPSHRQVSHNQTLSDRPRITRFAKSNGDKTMRKLIIRALAAVSLIAVFVPAVAEAANGQGIWRPHCYNLNSDGPTCY